MGFLQTLSIKQIFSVKNLKPAVIQVYDYYQTSKTKLLSAYLLIHLSLGNFAAYLNLISRWPVWSRVLKSLCLRSDAAEEATDVSITQTVLLHWIGINNYVAVSFNFIFGL